MGNSVSISRELLSSHLLSLNVIVLIISILLSKLSIEATIIVLQSLVSFDFGIFIVEKHIMPLLKPTKNEENSRPILSLITAITSTIIIILIHLIISHEYYFTMLTLFLLIVFGAFVIKNNHF